MNTIIKGKWLVVLSWALIITLLIITAPKMSDLVREKGQINVPNGYSSSRAEDILNEMHKDDKTEKSSQVALVFHENKKFTKSELDEVKKGVDELNTKKARLGITSITSPFDDETLKNKLFSKDGKTVLTSIEIEKGNRSSKQLSDELYQAVKNVKVSHYYTSGWMIDEDLITSSQEGLHKTEWITLIFILAVLIFVFRSLVAPIIPLIAVGITYITSQSIVAFLVDRYDFPLSTFTQIFLVALLFGIGTDYCILLLSRFKEELSHRESLTEAILVTYKNAGRTVLFSGLAVLIGFATIGLSTFKLYQSGAAVAIGVAVLLLSLFTIVPFFMAVLGKKIFWPAKGAIEHKQSHLWGFAGRFTFLRPLISLILVAIVAVPFLILYKGDLSFNSFDEIGDQYNSVKGFNIIANGFGPGESMPTQIVLKNDDPMDTQEYMGLIEKISREVSQVNGVDDVRSVTRPTGERIDNFLVTKQANTLKDGLGDSRDGLDKIGNGLTDASSSLKNSEPDLKKATDGIGQLINGTTDLKTGVIKLGDGLKQIEVGLRDGSSGAEQIKKALEKAKESAQTMADNSQQLASGYETMQGQLSKMTENYIALQSGFSQGLNSINNGLMGLAQNPKYYGISNDPDFKNAYGATQYLLKGDGQNPAPIDGFNQLNNGLTTLTGKMKEANDGFKQVAAAEQSLADGLNQLVNSLDQLQKGINQAADGQGKIIAKIPSVANGFNGIVYGQKQLKDGFSQLDDQMGQLTDGLDQSVNGLNKVSDGLGSAQNYLNELSNAGNKDLTGWYLPQETLTNKDFKTAMDHYMSKDRKIVTFDVIFKTNPYSTGTLDKIDQVKTAIHRVTKGTKLENAQMGIGGVTSVYSDLRAISKADYSRTVILMLIGIAIILIGLFRSLIMPIYIIASLVLTYFTSMGVAEVIFVHILGYSGINWSVPFFAFVMLVALGVDYSIFLMDRFNEYRELPVEQGMILAMKNMGTVILSAAIILGGTFAAMLPSGVLSLLQIATIIIAGLVLYSLIFLPLFIPLMVRTFGDANWWPFPKNTQKLDSNHHLDV